MKKILKSLVMVTLFAIVLTAFTGCEAQDIIDMLTKMVTGVCQHEIVTDPEVPATCTEKGLTEGYHCGKCDEVFLERFETKALGHKVGEDGKPATCTDPAVCGTCEESFGEALGHNWADATCAAPKTCKAEGCGATDGEADPENHTIGTPATCVAPAKCKDCEAEVGEANPANHDFGEDGVCAHCQYIYLEVYFKNVADWETVNAYSWTTEGDTTTNHMGAWPGAPMVLVNEDYAWYGMAFVVPSLDNIMIIFNNGNGDQTTDLAFDPAKPFWANGKAYATIQEAEAGYAADMTTTYSDWYVRGTMNSWGTADRLVLNEDGTATITMTFAVGDKFKVAKAEWSDGEFNISALSGNANFGGTNDIEVLVAGTYVITVSADGATLTIEPAQTDAE